MTALVMSYAAQINSYCKALLHLLGTTAGSTGHEHSRSDHALHRKRGAQARCSFFILGDHGDDHRTFIRIQFRIGRFANTVADLVGNVQLLTTQADKLCRIARISRCAGRQKC